MIKATEEATGHAWNRVLPPSGPPSRAWGPAQGNTKDEARRLGSRAGLAGKTRAKRSNCARVQRRVQHASKQAIAGGGLVALKRGTA